MYTVTANELKQKGISCLENHDETLVTVRGKGRYVVLDMEAYEHLREIELEMAVHEAKQDLEKGNYITESISDHIKRIIE